MRPGLTAPGEDYGPGLQADRQLIERTGVAGELNRAARDREPGVHIPQIVGGGQPGPPELFFDRSVRAGEGSRCLPWHRRRGDPAVGDGQGQAIEQQVDRARMRR
jgi:hypothetical protein